jgi:hypothetical protein
MAATDPVVERVRVTVEQAAEDALACGRAKLEVRQLSDLYEDPQYECPVVMLTPTDEQAAAVVVEVQEDDHWWLSAGEGPGTELHADIEADHGDRYTLLRRLVAAVVAGRYQHGPTAEQVRRLWRSPIERSGWRETYETERGPFSSTHFGREVPREARRFAPYL